MLLLLLPPLLPLSLPPLLLSALPLFLLLLPPLSLLLSLLLLLLLPLSLLLLLLLLSLLLLLLLLELLLLELLLELLLLLLLLLLSLLRLSLLRGLSLLRSSRSARSFCASVVDADPNDKTSKSRQERTNAVFGLFRKFAFMSGLRGRPGGDAAGAEKRSDEFLLRRSERGLLCTRLQSLGERRDRQTLWSFRFGGFIASRRSSGTRRKYTPRREC